MGGLARLLHRKTGTPGEGVTMGWLFKHAAWLISAASLLASFVVLLVVL